MAFPLRRPNVGITGWGADVNQNWADIEEMLTGLQVIAGIGMAGDINMLNYDILNINDLELTGDWPLLETELNTRYYTQEQILDLIAGATFNFWISDTADGVIGGYNRMFASDTEEAESTIGPTTIDADEKLIQAFVTAIAQPDFTTLSEGVFHLHIHANTTVGANVKAATIRWRLYRRTQPGGIETLLTTSEDGQALTAAETQEDIHAILPTEITLDPTDRLVLKVYGVRSGTEPTNPAITLYMEGDTQSRVEVRTILSTFDLRYLMVNGTNAMLAALDMGTFAITNVGLVDGVDIPALKTDLDGFPDQLKQLLTAEIQQLENIGATTISAAQWSWMGGLVNLLSLTEAQVGELLNIGATTVSAAQWAFLGSAANIMNLTEGELLQLTKIGTNVISIGQWSFLANAAALLSLSEAEITQLLNINATTISAAQWALLGSATALGGYTGRGDPSGWDWTISTLTADSTWNTLDLSGVAPAGAKAVLLNCRIKDNNVSKFFQIRNLDYSNGYNQSVMQTFVANLAYYANIIVELDADRKASYYIDTGMDECFIVVCGWWA